MIDVQALCERSHTISESKGWTQIKRTDAQNCNLIVSELSEALEDFRNNKGVNEIYFEGRDRDGDKKVYSFEEAKGLDFEAKGGMKPCGIPIEMADFLIRIAQHCGTNKHPLADVVSATKIADEAVGVLRRKDINEAIADATLFVSRAWEASPECDPEGNTHAMGRELGFLSKAFLTIVYFCEENGIDYEAAVTMKEKYNMTRPHRHGGKAI